MGGQCGAVALDEGGSRPCFGTLPDERPRGGLGAGQRSRGIALNEIEIAAPQQAFVVRFAQSGQHVHGQAAARGTGIGHAGRHQAQRRRGGRLQLRKQLGDGCGRIAEQRNPARIRHAGDIDAQAGEEDGLLGLVLLKGAAGEIVGGVGHGELIKRRKKSRTWRLILWRPQGDSNPRTHRERVMS